MAKLLIVDDRRENRTLMVTLLGRAGYQLLEAADGAEALALAKTEHPDLVIADILMPTMDGYELVRQLRSDPVLAWTPVIFWTAHYHEQQARALASKCGVSQVITKPARGETVLKAVETALEAARSIAIPPASLQGFEREHGDLLIDKLSRQTADLTATNDRLSALLELDMQLASETDLGKLIETFGHAARRIFGARYSVTGILDTDGKGFKSLFTSGMDDQTAAGIGAPDPAAAPLKSLLRDRRSLRLCNPGGDPKALGLSALHPSVHAWLGVPIASPTKVYGYVGLIDKVGLDEFSEEDERLTTILAAQVGRIYQNGSLSCEVLRQSACLEREIACREEAERALAERVSQAELVSEVHATLIQSDTQTEMLERCAQALVRNLGVAYAGVWTCNGGEQVLELNVIAGVDTGIPESMQRIPFGVGAIGTVAQQLAPFLTNDMGGNLAPGEKGWAKKNKIVSGAAYPLLIEGRLIGVLGTSGCRPFDAATTDVIKSVANKLSLGLERFHASDILREREEHIRLLLNSMKEAIYGVDLEGRCTFANSECARLLGYKEASELVGRNMHCLIHHTRLDGTPYTAEDCRIFEATRDVQGSHVDDEVFWRADGSSFPVEYWTNRIYRGGQLTGVVVAFVDITERRALEGHFRQSQERLRHIVASSPVVLFTLSVALDKPSHISWISDNLQKVMGYPTDGADCANWWDSKVHPDDLEKVKPRADAELFTRGQSIVEYRFRHGDGTYHWTRCDLRMIRRETGQPLEVVGAWSDISELKEAEEERTKLGMQLEQTLKLESIGQLAGGVAHDFHNLLGIIVGYVEIIQSDLPNDSKLREYTHAVLDAAERATDLTRQLLAFGRKQVLQPKVLSMSVLVGEFKKMLRRIVPENIEISARLESSGNVRVDAGQIEQIVMNLVANARDAMPGGGRLTLKTRDVELDEMYTQQHPNMKPGPYVMLEVSDTGCGISPDVMTRIFEPFFTTKEVGKGTGLGLGTVHGIVNQSGGSIYAYSEPGQGATFRVYLPRIEGIEAACAKAAPPEAIRGNETILLAEDEAGLRNLVSETLQGLGYTVLAAENGEDALRISGGHEGRIDLLVTDVIMPRIGGRELADRLVEVRSTLRVLYVSGYPNDSAIIDGVFSHQTNFLQKPVAKADLARKVRDVLDAGSCIERVYEGSAC